MMLGVDCEIRGPFSTIGSLDLLNLTVVLIFGLLCYTAEIIGVLRLATGGVCLKKLN